MSKDTKKIKDSMPRSNTTHKSLEPVFKKIRQDIPQEIKTRTFIQEENMMVKFLVGEEKVMFEEDLSVLVSCSPVFLKMFCGSMKEESPVHVTDTTPEVFSTMLKFLSDSSYPLPEDEIPSILYLAEKYMIHKLKKACVMRMQPTVDTVCSVLNMALTFNIDELKQEGLRVFSENTDAILNNSKSFNLLNKEALMAALQCEMLANTSESQIFDAVLAWAKHQCEQQGLSCDGEQLRKQLQGVLKHIRFLNMTLEEFNKVKESEVLTSQQVEEYDKYTRSKGAIKPKLLYPVARPRQNSKYFSLSVPYHRVVSSSSSKDVCYTSTSGKQLEEKFEMQSSLTLIGIILPTQEVTGNCGFTYLEDVTIHIHCDNITSVSTVHYRAEVTCGTNICVMLREEYKVPERYSYMCTLSVDITFGSSGLYPFNSNRNFGTSYVDQKTGGIITGFVFKSF